MYVIHKYYNVHPTVRSFQLSKQHLTSSPCKSCKKQRLFYFVFFFATGFLCVALAVLEIRLASNSDPPASAPLLPPVLRFKGERHYSLAKGIIILTDLLKQKSFATQKSLTPAPGDPTPSPGRHGHSTHVVPAHRHRLTNKRQPRTRSSRVQSRPEHAKGAHNLGHPNLVSVASPTGLESRVTVRPRPGKCAHS